MSGRRRLRGAAVPLLLAVFAAVGAPAVTPTVVGAQTDIGFTVVETADGGCVLATIGLTDGVVTQLPDGSSPAKCVNDIGFGADGVLYAVDEQEEPVSVHLLRFDTTTGAITDLGPLTGAFTVARMGGNTEGGVASGGDGNLYVEMLSDEPSCLLFQCLYRVDPATLQATLVGPSGTSGSVFEDRSFFGLTADCGTTLWSTFRSGTDATPALVILALATGAGTQGPPIGFSSATNVNGLELDRNTNTMYALMEDPNETPARGLYTIDLETGARTLVAEPSNLLRNRTLAIEGTCPTPPPPPPAPPAPDLVLQPTFTG